MMERYDVGPRMSEMTVYNKVAYLSGQIPEDTSQDITGQTRQVLAEIDKLLALVASDRQHVLRAEVFLADSAGIASRRAPVHAHLAARHRLRIRAAAVVAALPALGLRQQAVEAFGQGRD